MTKEQVQTAIAEKFFDEIFDILNEVNKNTRNMFVKDRKKIIEKLIEKMNEED